MTLALLTLHLRKHLKKILQRVTDFRSSGCVHAGSVLLHLSSPLPGPPPAAAPLSRAGLPRAQAPPRRRRCRPLGGPGPGGWRRLLTAWRPRETRSGGPRAGPCPPSATVRRTSARAGGLRRAGDDEYEWKGPFYFIQGADPQFGLIKSWAVGDTNNGDDEWKEEIKLTEQAVQAVNKLNPKPKFFVLCGDLIHGMPGIKAVFSGHYHRNAGGSYRGLEMVVTSAIGCQLGEDTHGLRVVVVTDEKIVHRYYSLDELSSQGMEKELLDMLAKQI
ncbi:serine/threonine-protein phosphatase CPPED1 isoform X6 [Anas acuta]|uniref:serine/threonine-protein phosphatase CPPED1 isoform X6 n=1 Tax=Anas acuta TaxID=28680 RepID=UPI0035C8AD95